MFLAPSIHASPLFTAPALLFPTDDTPVAVAMADLDRDGHLDLVVSNANVSGPSHQGSVSVFLGLGDGTFRPRVDYTVPGTPQGIAVADLDGDDRLDVVVATNGTGPGNAGGACVLLGTGDGTLRTPIAFAAGKGLRSVCIADLDRDGHLDLVTNESSLLGNGDGTFGPPTEFGVSGETWGAVADLNGDGILDVATSLPAYPPDPDYESAPPVVLVRPGLGDGTFGPATGYGVGNNAQSVAIADMDRDGHADLVVGNFGDGDEGSDLHTTVSVLHNNGDGTFGGQRSFRTGNSPYAIAVADLDGDGWPDIATANFDGDPDFNSNSITVLLSSRDGNLQQKDELPGGEYPRALAVGDVDGNGIPDLVAVNERSNTLSVMLGNGDGTFGARRFRTSHTALTLDPADLNGDGEVDLVVENVDRTSTIATLLGRGDGTFGTSADFGGWGTYIFAAVGDVNDDGRPDVAVVSENDNVVSTLYGNGDGTLGARADHPTGQNPKGVQIVDLDGDGFPELVVANARVGTLSVLPGTGPGTFGVAVDYETGRFPQLLGKADLNADGRWDLVVGNAGSATVSAFLGNGDRTLTRKDLPTGDAPRSVCIADLDGDGFLDLALVAGPSVLVHRGHGDGTFDPGIEIAPHEGAYGVACADLDGDGKLDLAVTYRELRTISILLGHGDLMFGPPIDFGASANGIAAVDLNHDGMTDLVVALGDITVLMNRTPPPAHVTPSLRITPPTLEPGTSGRWITAMLTFPAPYSASDVDLASVRLQGSVPADPSSAVVRGRGRERAEVLVLRFDRALAARALRPGERIAVSVAGMVGAARFAATDTIRVLGGGAPLPVAGKPEPTGSGSPLGLRIRSGRGAAGGQLRFEVTLSEAGPATLELLDLAGRIRASRPVDALGPGAHELALDPRNMLSPGVYFARVKQAGHSAAARTVVLR